jgi:hypothetical protein
MTRLKEPGSEMPHIHMTGLPIQCSSCAGQDSGARHIDFEAECDRGWYGSDPGTHIVMDDLILREHCIKEAATLLGWGDEETLRAENRNVVSELERTKLDLRRRGGAPKATGVRARRGDSYER